MVWRLAKMRLKIKRSFLSDLIRPGQRSTLDLFGDAKSGATAPASGKSEQVRCRATRLLAGAAPGQLRGVGHAPLSGEFERARESPSVPGFTFWRGL